MDIRDVKEEVPKYGNNGLELMFTLQQILIDHYVGIEGIVKPPVSIHSKADQILLKDFMGRVVEELGEAWESIEALGSRFMELPGGVTGFTWDDSVLSHLQNFNEELADAIHFYLELLIFVDIKALDVMKYLGRGLEVDNLETIVKICQGRNNYYPERVTPENIGLTPIVPIEKSMELYLVGGSYLSKDTISTGKKLMWEITYRLQLARNCLKNKPWKQSEMLSDQQRFNDQLLAGFIAMFQMLEYFGHTKESIVHIYFKKNCINLFRIKSKY